MGAAQSKDPVSPSENARDPSTAFRPASAHDGTPLRMTAFFEMFPNPYSAAGAMLITTNLLVGVFERSATLSIGTSTFVSGKYVAVQPRGMS